MQNAKLKQKAIANNMLIFKHLKVFIISYHEIEFKGKESMCLHVRVNKKCT